MKGIKRIDRNYYHVRVYATDRRTLPHRKVERARWVRGTFAEAKCARADLQEQLDAELAGTGERMTLTDFMRRWLEVREGELAPSTKAKYVNDLENHILPVLGDYMLDQLRPSTVQAMLAGDSGAPNSRNNRLAILRKLSKDAQRDGLIERDLCLGRTVKVPRVYTEAQPNCLHGPVLDRVLAKIPPSWHDLAAMLTFTGLRWGEVSAFHWADIDPEGATGTVRWSNWKGHLKAPKNDNGFRVVPLTGPSPELLAVVEQLPTLTEPRLKVA